METNRAAETVGIEEIKEWVIRALAIPSYCGIPAQEEGMAEFFRALFASEGIECRVDHLPGGRANVYAWLRGTGGGRSLMLNGHMDTVPPYDMERATDPYIEGTRIHGRGSSDMKGPLVCMAAALIALKRSGIRLAGDVIFSGVADEEQRSIGAVDMIERGIRADGAIVGEPTGHNTVYIAQKGLEWFEFKLTGRTVHGSRQDAGVNAILKAVDLINALNSELLPKLRSRTDPVLGASTMNIGVIRGGTQLSTVAGECSVLVDRRFLPDIETYEGMLNELQGLIDGLSARDKDFVCSLSVTEDSVMKAGYVHQGMRQREDSPLVAAMSAAVKTATGGEALLTGCPCWTDAGLISAYAGMPVIVYGPGEMEHCHSSREYIEIPQLEEGYRVYTAMLLEFCK